MFSFPSCLCVCVCVSYLGVGGHMPQGCFMRKQDVRGGVMHWAMFCRGSLGLDGIVDGAVLLHMHLPVPKIFQSIHTFSWKQYSVVAVASIDRMDWPQSWAWSMKRSRSLRNTRIIRCWLCLQIVNLWVVLYHRLETIRDGCWLLISTVKQTQVS